MTEFQLEGQFLRFELEDGYKLKWLWLATPEGEQCIKLSKESRASVGRVLTPGEWVRVVGRQKMDGDTGATKLKAEVIVPIAPRQLDQPIERTAQEPSTPAKLQQKVTVLVCQKSDCWRRGGQAVCQALESAFADRGLVDQVTVRKTGCMKQCKSGPNVVVMPGKTRYAHIRPEEIPALVERHFPAQGCSKEHGRN